MIAVLSLGSPQSTRARWWLGLVLFFSESLVRDPVLSPENLPEKKLLNKLYLQPIVPYTLPVQGPLSPGRLFTALKGNKGGPLNQIICPHFVMALVVHFYSAFDVSKNFYIPRT